MVSYMKKKLVLCNKVLVTNMTHVVFATGSIHFVMMLVHVTSQTLRIRKPRVITKCTFISHLPRVMDH